MTQEQQGDVSLFQTDDDGNIEVVGGIVTMSGGLETAAYLALFGGNEDDDGRADNPDNWWGNLDEVDPDRRYRSETQNLLQALPATSGNLPRIDDAANRDLAFFVTKKIASSVSVDTSIPAINRIRVAIDIKAQGVESRFEFTENWKATA